MSNISIPKFYEFLAPILKYCGDGKEHTLSETIDKMAYEFRLTEDQKNALLPSGNRTYVYERITWAITYLVEAGLIERTGRSKFKITGLGISELKVMPERISYSYLEKFPSFVKFKEGRQPGKKDENEISNMTPDEEIDTLFRKRKDMLAETLLNRISKIKPSDFEKLIIDVIIKMGYGKDNEEMAKALGKTGDQGIDGEIYQDKLGLDKIYLQAKKWGIDSSVGGGEVRNFMGGLSKKHAKKGIFITTASFTSEAKETAEQDADHKVVLIDGHQLANLMIDYGIGVRTVKTYNLSEIDEDYFESF